MDIYVRERKSALFIRFPWLPESIEMDNGGGKFAIYDILDKGEVAVPSGENLEHYSWESKFPGKNNSNKSLLRGVWMDPNVYLQILKRWKKEGTPLQILIIGTAIIDDVLLDEFEGAFAGAFGDFDYRISFIQDKNISITSKNVKQASTKRSETVSSTKSYTIKKGDTLWEISEKFLGKGSSWEKIYDANKTIIEKEAKKRGMKSSDHGWWIFPGVKIVIPTS